jgi:hypothetical protein
MTMTIANFAAWESELIVTGRIVQDDDISVTVDEAERRFNRYIALVEMVEGNEGTNAARALYRSIQAQHDYGAYQNTINKLLFSFPVAQTVAALVAELPRLIAELPDWAGDLISSLAQAEGRSDALTQAFNTCLRIANAETRNFIVEFIRNQEKSGGWLEYEQGVVGV